jgi:alpha-L-fucosidase
MKTKIALMAVAAMLLQSRAMGAAQLATPAEEARLQQQYPGYRKVDDDYRHAGEAALERWQDWKWGLRIHWGLYAAYDTHESWIISEHKNDTNWLMNYYASYQWFNPTNFNADQWMDIMQRAGMKYFSFTSKHHEGFCLWPTKTLQRGFRKNAGGTFTEVTNHFSIAETPFQRDVIGELVNSARASIGREPLLFAH